MRYHIRLSGVIFAVISLLVLCSVAYPATIYVKPGGLDANDGSSWNLAKRTIAGGIEASEAGDEIWVAAGTYTERILIKSGIALYGGFSESETDKDDRNWDTNLTIIDASTLPPSDSGSTVTFGVGQSTNTCLDGFVISGGTGTLVDSYYFGGGIFCTNYSSPTIANNVITENTATNGAGIYCYDWSSPVITNNKITKNVAEDRGGAICCSYNPLAIISDNLIELNEGRWGAGIACFNAAVNITNNRIWHNSADTGIGSSGGGIYCEYLSSSTISGNVIVANTAKAGGGVNLANFSGSFISNRVTANSAEFGGGLNIANTTAVIASNIINGNDVDKVGGGIYCSKYSSSKIINNTIVSNLAGVSGGGIGLHDSAPMIANNIIAFNTTGISLSKSENYSGSAPNIKYNCVYKNRDTDYYGVAKGSSDIQVDPKLASVKYGNLHIQPDSPCINKGLNEVPNLPTYDFDGETRKLGTRVDIGADEVDQTDPITWAEEPASVVYVSTAGNDDNDGMNWDAAKLTIQAAVDEAVKYGSDIWVAEGQYDEHVITRPYTHIFGGFFGDELEKTDRDSVAHESIIFPQTEGRVITIIRAHGLNTIDGLVLTGVDITNTEDIVGAAVYCEEASPLITNNTITDCVAVSGGAIGCDKKSNPVIASNIIRDCEALMEGGAIYCIGQSSPLIKNNRISGNTAGSSGAGIYLEGECSSIITNNIIEDNELPLDNGGVGGAIACLNNEDYLSPTITNNTIIRNQAVQGGAIYMAATKPLIANNIFAYNHTGILVPTSAKPIIKNNCVFENTTYNYSGTFPGTGDIEANPKFVDVVGGDYHLNSNSPCIDAGNSSVVLDGVYDLDSSSRIYGAYVDMGVDEWRGLFNQGLSPNKGALSPSRQITLTSVYSHPEGYENIESCYFLLNTTCTGADGIMVKYVASSNQLYVKNDANTDWSSGYAPGSSNIIENSRVKLYCAGTTVSGSGETLTINWRVEIKPTMAGKNCSAWMMVGDNSGLIDGWDTMGQFDISYAPVNVSVSPSSGALAVGTKVSLTSKYSDLDGYTKISACYLLINTSLSSVNAVHLRYDAKTNRLYVRKDDDSAWVGGFAPGTANTIDNSRVRLYCANTVVSGSGSTRTVKWSVMLKSPLSGNTCGVWMRAVDITSQVELGTEGDGGWKLKGTLALSQPPVNVSLSPSSGTLISGSTSTLIAKYSDADGFADIAACYLLMNTTQATLNGIFAKYDAVSNKLYLTDSANTGWQGGFTPGTNNVIQNNFCTLDCSQTTVYRAGNMITVNWKIKIKPTMAGKTLGAWLLVIDKSDLRDNYEKMGQFKIGNPL